MRPYILAESNWKNIRQQPIDLVILPWGATEAHNYHLPYATDNYQVEMIAAEAARKAWEKGARIMVLPCIPFGVNTGQMDIRLDINMHPSTQAAVLHDILEVLDLQGFRKLLILNGHGGNDFKAIVREAGVAWPDIFISVCTWFAMMENERYFDEPGDHAGELETSLMMHLRPDLVLPLREAGSGSQRAFKVRAFREGWAWAERKWSEISQDTGVGNPAAASAEKGKRYFKDLTSRLSEFFIDLAAADPDDLYE